MLSIAVIVLLVTQGSWVTMLPMLLMSLAWPVANLIGQASQKKDYLRKVQQREADYRQRIAEERKRLEGLAHQQRSLLEGAYPAPHVLIQMARAQSPRMWSRRPTDDDFLSLRLGTGAAPPSFTVEMPRLSGEDALLELAAQVVQEFRSLPSLPLLLDLKRCGSVAISGPPTCVYGLARRLVLDLVVHHSPEDVSLVVLGDTRQAWENWGWLKWVPHTDSLAKDKEVHRLALEPIQIEKCLESLLSEYHLRRSEKALQESPPVGRQAIVVLVDDSGEIRQRPEVHALAESGYEAEIYPIFVGGRGWPRECRSRIDLLEGGQFRLVETWSRDGAVRQGIFESASPAEAERVARRLACLEVAGRKARVPLPEEVRLSEVVGAGTLSFETVKGFWSRPSEPKELLRFPIGLCARHDRLEPVMLNLLPGAYGGNDAYHTILIGMTGSGKSEFMKSMVLGAALRYSPEVLNFFFLDFKGGAAFQIFSDLPHVTGVVTNLSPELVERGLKAIQNEIERRQRLFGGQVQNIWDYNRGRREGLLPHLVLFLDEFTRGLADFPDLRAVLDLLVRQGRSLGMYLVLANQDVNAEVDKLLNNVGWRIALKVAKREEMAMIDRALRSPVRAGQGYLRSLTGDIIEFQAGYAGLPMSPASGDGDEFAIYEVETDGSYRTAYEKAREVSQAGEAPALKEEEYILELVKQATAELNIRPATRIYLDPLPPKISLEQVFSEASVQPAYQDGAWIRPEALRHVVACWGKMDIPEECRQEVLQTDFDDRDGHLWLIGVQGSGRDMALTTLLISLALTHTPEQLHFYLLDLAGELGPLADLPHTGALISPRKDDAAENERFLRLLGFLDQEMQRRAASRQKETAERAHEAAIFVVINSFAGLRADFPDEVERLARYVRDGGRLGIHFIITTSRGAELTRSISDVISRRLVLQLADKEGYIEVIGRQVEPLKENIPGRGYWVDGGQAILCQAADFAQARETVRGMRQAWKGKLPLPIEILPVCLPLALLLRKAPRRAGEVRIPVGQRYDNLEPILLDPATYSPFWLILGPRESGKSNFLACVARGVLEQDGDERWLLKAYALRRGPLEALARKEPRLSVLTSPEEILNDCQELAGSLKGGLPEGKRLLLLIDDLGVAFQPGQEKLATGLNSLATTLETAGRVTVMSSGLMDELRMQIASPLVKLLRQYRTGLVLSKDANEVDWLATGVQIPLEYRRKELPPGRGFFLHKGKISFVQTPWLGDFEKRAGEETQ